MGYLTSLDTFFLCAFGHLFAAFAYCSIKHGFVVSIDNIIRNNEAHEALARKRHGGKVAPEEAEEVAEPERLPEAIPGLIAWARAICRGLPAYVRGGAWAGLNLHQRLDLVVICTFCATYIISAASEWARSLRAKHRTRPLLPSHRPPVPPHPKQSRSGGDKNTKGG